MDTKAKELDADLPVCDQQSQSMAWIAMSHSDQWLRMWQAHFEKKCDEKELRNLRRVFEYARLGMDDIDDASLLAERLLSQELRKIADRLDDPPAKLSVDVCSGASGSALAVAATTTAQPG